MSVLAKRQLMTWHRDVFANAADDYNSVHYGDDAIAHGLHVVGWAIGRIVKDGDVIVSTQIQFRNPVPVGSEIELRLAFRSGHHTRLAVYVGDTQAVVIDVKIKRAAR